MSSRVMITVGLAIASALVDATVALAQPAATVRSSLERAQIAAVTLRLYNESDARVQHVSAEARRLRTEVEALSARLAQNRTVLAGLRTRGHAAEARAAEVEREKRQLESAFAERTEALTADFARQSVEFSAQLRTVVEATRRILDTAEGQRVLELIASGSSENLDEASRIVSRISRVRAALNDRETAALFLALRGHGEATTPAIIRLYQTAVDAGIATYGDYLQLSRLYRDVQSYQDSLNMAERALKASTDDRERSYALYAVGIAQRARETNRGGEVRSRDSFIKGEELARRRLSEAPAGERHHFREYLFANLVGSFDVLADAHDYAAALQKAQEAVALAQTMDREHPNTPEHRYHLYLAGIRIAEAHAALQSSDAQREYLDALGMLTALDGRPTGKYAAEIGYVNDKVAALLYARGDFSDARDRYQLVRTIGLALTAGDPENISHAIQLIGAQSGLAESLSRLGDASGAIALLRDNISRSRAIVEGHNTSAFCECALSEAYLRLGELLLAQRDAEAARQNFLLGLAVAERRQNLDVGNRSYKSEVARALWYLAALGHPGYPWSRAAAQFDLLQKSGGLTAREEVMAAEAKRQMAAAPTP